MSSYLPKCKITVIKRSLNKDLIDQFISEEYTGMKPCEIFKEGQEIIIDPNTGKIPKHFCDWAWADIRHHINMIASGGNMMGMRNVGTAIAACSDYLRPVYFKIERMD